MLPRLFECWVFEYASALLIFPPLFVDVVSRKRIYLAFLQLSQIKACQKMINDVVSSVLKPDKLETFTVHFFVFAKLCELMLHKH